MTGALTPYILIVEDEEPISLLLQYNLERAGYAVRVEENGEEALFAVEEKRPDLIVLDWMLPGLSGIEVLRKLRASEETRLIPVIMVTARGEESDRILGLDIGADDYIVKPFSPKELASRIKAVLRRVRPVFEEQKLEFEGVTLDMNRRAASYGKKALPLGPTEFRMLSYFMEHPGKAFTREQLLDAVWGADVYVEIRTVDVHIRRLRKALGEAAPELEELIRTVRGTGYMLDKPAR